MLKNQWNALKICLLVQTWSRENLENTSKFEGWDLTLVADKKSADEVRPKLIVKYSYLLTESCLIE